MTPSAVYGKGLAAFPDFAERADTFLAVCFFAGAAGRGVAAFVTGLVAVALFAATLAFVLFLGVVLDEALLLLIAPALVVAELAVLTGVAFFTLAVDSFCGAATFFATVFFATASFAADMALLDDFLLTVGRLSTVACLLLRLNAGFAFDFTVCASSRIANRDQ